MRAGNTPSLRVAGSEDEDENEAPYEQVGMQSGPVRGVFSFCAKG
jgi:hypothetical protein